jgi:glycosyltransferase involved in cell wall biosynthesis
MRILHVVSTGRRRGAEIFASDLIAATNGESLDQQVAILRAVGPIRVPYAAPSIVVRRSANGERLRLGSIRSLRRLIRSWEPDVVLAHGGEALKYSLLADRKPARLVYRRIGSVHPRTTSGARRILYGAMMRRASRVVALADAIRDETVRTFGVATERIMTIPNGVDPERLLPRRSTEETRKHLGIPPDALMVLSLGAFTWEKDPQAQVDIAEQVAAEFEGTARFVMAGEGPLRPKIEDAVARRNLDRLVLVPGHREDAPDLLAASDVLLVSSRTEGTPAAVIEAGMVGVPVVAFQVGGMAEVVRDGTTGLLAPPGDARSLGSNVLGLLRDPEARSGMGRAARTWCRARFDIRDVAPRYLSLYRDVTGVARPSVRSGGEQ